MRLKLAVSAIGLALLVSAAAAAEETNDEKARTWFKQGVKRFDEQKFDDALYAFEQADRLNPSWKIAFNIGQCQAALKRYGLAIEAFERYLAEGGDEVPDDRRTKVLDELSQFRKMVGGVMVTGEDDVVVVIDDIVRGSTPMNQPILVTAGVKHNIKMVKQEEVLKTVQETVRGESTLEIRVSGGEAGAPVPAPAPAAATTDTAPAEAEDEGGLSPVFFWVGAGATLAFTGGAVGLNFAIAGKKNDDGEVPSGDYDAAKGMRAAGLACFGLAIAAGVTTVVLAFFTDWDGDGDEEMVADLQLGAFGSADGGGLALGGTF
jgi:hypothetical protein